ncbi:MULTISPECIES: glycosyltransferase [unclassified Pseudodesulfovibrio]|uniref:glycosyltransferase n=1 Tax=unclassified Pseudodesulfovibrio TaxID=2661612 RepID=UPI000FEB9113|nr:MULTISPECIES: glycosyltransferase [unclassified Pseudodesulfovibrio]MCJ2165777.1 glycosyltransferase [Pseudodesulfovibrio sp. S3-i]RWU02855.1 glycosyltransferase [Pseudodesulfovibrio sp. S3]
MINTSIPVFCYHNVSDVDGHTPELFREHLDAIVDAGWKTISCRELLSVTRGERKAPKKSLVLTFDDGHLSNWLTVVPELEKRNMTGTFFVLTDFTVPGNTRTVATAPEMLPMRQVFRAAHVDGDFSQFINESEIKAMLAKGMEVFSHGCRHQAAFIDLKPLPAMGDQGAHWGAWSIYPGHNDRWPTFKAVSAYVHDGFWPRLEGLDGPRFVKRSPEERLDFCRRDFAKSFKRIQALNGYDEQLFCWPWGQFDKASEAELKNAGYAGAFTLERGPNQEGTNPFRLNRLGVGRNKDAKWLRMRLKMYGSTPAARICFKFYTKRPEINSVLYATDSNKLSGGSRQMVNNIRAMAAMGVKVYALVTPDTAINSALEGLDVEVIHYDRFNEYRRAGKFLKELVKEKGIDVVHTFHNRAYKMGVLARLMGAKCKLFINRGVISRPNAVFFLWAALANGVIANSVQCAEVLRRYWVGKGRLNVVYNAYAGPDFGDPKPRKKRGTRFIYIGNSADIKGFDVFLAAADKVCRSGVRDVEFVGVGVTPDKLDKFDALLTPAVRERYRNEGEIPHADVLDALRFADVQVVSSRMESLPNTLLEGFDLGVPAVCTRVGGIPEVVRDGVNGYLCDSEDSACLAEKMLVLAEDPGKRFDMGCAGRKVVRTLLTPEAKGRNLMRVYMGETLFEPLPVETVASCTGAEEHQDDQGRH